MSGAAQTVGAFPDLRRVPVDEDDTSHGSEQDTVVRRAASATKGHRIFAALYDRLRAAAERRFLGEHRAYLAGLARGRVLDLGAGTGANFLHFGPDARVVAVEPDPHMLRRAAALGRPIALVRAPAEDLPFPDASFDTVVVTANSAAQAPAFRAGNSRPSVVVS